MASILNVDKIRRAAGSTDALAIDTVAIGLQHPLGQRSMPKELELMLHQEILILSIA